MKEWMEENYEERMEYKKKYNKLTIICDICGKEGLKCN